DGDIGGAVDDLVVLPDLDADRIEVEHRVELLQRPRLPRGDLFQHRVGDVRDRLVRQIRAEGGGQVMLDVANRPPVIVEADDHVIQPAQAPPPLRDQARGERAGPIPRDLQLDRPELGLHRLRRGPVAGVGVLRRLAGALLIAQVAGQLGLQTPLERCLDQGGYEPAVTGQLDLASVDLLEQGIQLPGGLQLLDQILARGPIVMLLLLVRHGHYCSVPLGTAYTDHLTRPTDDYRESRFHDAVLPWSIIAGRSHDT